MAVKVEEKVRHGTPWSIALPYEGCDGSQVDAMIFDEDGLNVAEAFDRVDGEFIVRACNAHDDLTSACEAAAKHLTNFLGRSALEHVDDRGVVRQLVAALAKARGGA